MGCRVQLAAAVRVPCIPCYCPACSLAAHTDILLLFSSCRHTCILIAATATATAVAVAAAAPAAASLANEALHSLQPVHILLLPMRHKQTHTPGSQQQGQSGVLGCSRRAILHEWVGNGA